MSNIGDNINQLRNLRDKVRDGYTRLQGGLQGAITPDEFLNSINTDMQNFISDPKWQNILGMIPFQALLDQYNNLTTHISFYNGAFNISNEQRVEQEFNEIKGSVNRIILNLSSSIQTFEQVDPNVRTESVEENLKLDAEVKTKSSSRNQSINVTTGKLTSVTNQQRPLAGTERKTKNLNIRLDSLLYSLGTLITEVGTWEKLTRTTKIEFLGNTSSAYVTLVENYQSSWSDLTMDLKDDYDTVWKKIENDNNRLMDNFEILIEAINELKDPRNSIMTIRKEIRNRVSTMIEIVRSETSQNGDSN